MNPTIASITLRALLGRRRFLLLLPLPLLFVGLAVLARSLGATPEQMGEPIFSGLGFSVVLPIIALIVATGVLGSEIDDGTLVHILAKPLPRSEIILTKLFVAIGVTAVTAGIPAYAAGLVAGSSQLALGLLAGTTLGAVGYSALFLALSLITRRPVLIGLVYLLIWEGVLGGLLAGTRLLSIRQYVIAVADSVADSAVLTGSLSVVLALVMTAILTTAGTLLAIDRLRSFSVAGETS